jgi:pyruvate dehydrogenase E1 component alpha subunit
MSVDAARHREQLLATDRSLDMLRMMLLIRRFEERSAEAYAEGKIRGFLHLYIGEEAVAVGAMQALEPEDPVVATYREHGQALARGVSPGGIMAEMYGKVNGVSRGRGGSMHLFDAARRFYGGHAIVGGGLPFAVGMALAHQMQKRSLVTACFFGEGAVAEGEFHESLNLAMLWKLPVLFLCENNLYAMGTGLERSESEQDIHLKAQSYRMPSEAVDGMDVLAVEEAARRGAAHVRRGDGPYFIEFRTYRFRAHSMADPELYREKQEVNDWKKRDPIPLFVERLKRAGVLGDTDLQRITQDVETEVSWAVEEAESGAWEPVEELTRDVYTPTAPTRPA